MMDKVVTKPIWLAFLSAVWMAGLAIWFLSTEAYGTGKNHTNILSIGGSVTEIVYALNEEHRLVARDTTSSYPPPAQDLPDVGYMRALSPEGVLSVDPDLIISEDGAGPAETIELLKSTGVPFVTVPQVVDGTGIAEKIRIVGEALGVEDKADILAVNVEADLAEAQLNAAQQAGATPKKVMFILSLQGGRVMASGAGTAADAIIQLAGGENAVSGFEGYKVLSDEAVTQAAPDVILMMDRGGDHSVTDQVLFSIPAITPTPAANDGAIVRMNGLYLLGFGPRTAEAVNDLSAALYGG